ncbi:MAG: hypothetical protein JSV95_03915 [Gemmatimonadota bacterium]|nr:MAG: hypothetical protein JSV95_03915 [Gemmatimonadota bacterium]
MRSARRLSLFGIVAALLLPGCSKSLTVQHDETLDQRVVRTSANVLDVNRSLCTHRLALDAAKLEGDASAGGREPEGAAGSVEGAQYGLLASLSGPVWVRPQSLVIEADDQRWVFEESTTAEFYASCPERSRVQRSLGMAAAPFGCVFREAYWYDVTIDQLRVLGAAREATVRLEGVGGYVERGFSEANKARFRELIELQASDTTSADTPLP